MKAVSYQQIDFDGSTENSQELENIPQKTQGEEIEEDYITAANQHEKDADDGSFDAGQGERVKDAP